MWGFPSLIADPEWLECADEDRRARRRKLGLPEELTEEEKAQEAAAAAQKAEAAKKKSSFVSVKPVSGRLLLASVQSLYKTQEYCQDNCAPFGTLHAAVQVPDTLPQMVEMPSLCLVIAAGDMAQSDRATKRAT